MKKLLAVVMLAMCPGVAGAADMPMHAPASEAFVPAADHNWSGFYLGMQGGSGWGESDFRQSTLSSNFVEIEGVMFGGTAGLNYEVANWLIAGLEADISYAEIDGSFTGILPGGFGCGSVSCTTSLDWFATARGRIGLTFDRFMIFGTGGLAVANVKSELENAPGYAVDDTSVGWAAGGGVEFAFHEHWSAKIEYLHIELGKTDPAQNTFRTSNEFDLVRAGVNFQF